ncbi:fibronectin type III domain-containing protein [Actinomadura fulvescens]|uniref:fibronectin type III domain-containing protein n=1 Tax=Actinomadura fulvescens TaxID=46160 RepID=UPI0031D861C4
MRRDRVTGQVAIGLVGVLVVSALVYGVGMASSRYKLSDVGAWLTATGKGMVVHANGLLGKVDGKTQIQAAPNHRIKIIQDGNTVLLVNETTGVVSRIDPSQLKVTQSQRFGIGLQIVAAEGVAYTLDPVKGLVQQINPVTLAPIGRATALTPPIRPGGLDPRGTFWVPTEQSGQLIPFQNGVQGKPVTVAQPGAQLQLSMVAGVPTVIDTTSGTAAIAGPDGVRKVALLSSVRDNPKVPAKVEGQTLPILGTGGALVLLDTGTGRLTSAGLRLPQRHSFGAPQVLGPKVFIPDETAGALIVYNATTGRFEQTIRVSGKPGPLDVFVKDGMLWANDPYGDKAVSVDQNGQRRNIQKYTDKVPGGIRRPIPSQGAGGDRDGNPGGNGDRGGDRPGRPLPPNKPNRPNQPPSAPTSVVATGENGTVTVRFGRSARYRVQPTGYVLKYADGRPVDGVAEVPDNTPNTEFSVPNLPCEQEFQFRVVVRYQDPRSKSFRNGASGISNKTTACRNPAAPTGVTAVPDANGTITVSFTPGGDTTAVKKYVLTNDGGTSYPGVAPLPKGQSRFVVSGLECKAEDYTFKVTAVYDKGDGEGQAPSQETANARACSQPSPVSGLEATAENHGAQLKWNKVEGNGITYTVQSSAGTKSGLTETSYKVSGLRNGQSHDLTVTAVNAAGSSPATRTVNLDPAAHAQNYNGHHNNSTETTLRAGPNTNERKVGSFPKGFTGSVKVICQESGGLATDSDDASRKSSVWDKIEYEGNVVWVSDLFVATPESANGFSVPPLWNCT